jgi:hypothetical protein
MWGSAPAPGAASRRHRRLDRFVTQPALLQAERMSAFWGDDTCKKAAYDTCGNLFGWEEKQSNDAIAAAFRNRIQKVAGFQHVPEPIPMRNSKGAIVYYLFFASPKPVAAKIVADIFAKYRNKGTM